MSLIENGKNPYLEMSNEKLAFEIGRLEMYGNLSGYAQKLLSAAKIRLEGNSDSTGRVVDDVLPDSRIAGINLAAFHAEENHKLHLVNMVKELVYGYLPDQPIAPAERVVNDILLRIEERVSGERLAKGTVTVEIQKAVVEGGVKWRVFVDIPNEELRGVFVRHYIAPGQCYAYPIEYIKTNPAPETEPFSVIPPLWPATDWFTGLTVDFDSRVIIHTYRSLGKDASGEFRCEMDGTVISHEQP